jgi:hypothetical protein
MRFRRPAVRREHELDEEPVLFDDPETVTILAYDEPVAALLPGTVRFFHQVAAVAELRILLDVIVIPYGKHDADDRNEQQDRHQDGLLF